MLVEIARLRHERFLALLVLSRQSIPQPERRSAAERARPPIVIRRLQSPSLPSGLPVAQSARPPMFALPRVEFEQVDVLDRQILHITKELARCTPIR
jgi:hypothetical protein